MEKVSAWHGTAPQYAPHPPPKKTRFLTLKPIFNVMFVASCHFPDLLSENKTTHDCGIKTTLNKNKSSLSIVFWKLSSFSLGIIIISHLHLLQIFLGPKTSFLSPPMEITICPYPTPPFRHLLPRRWLLHRPFGRRLGRWQRRRSLRRLGRCGRSRGDLGSGGERRLCP